MRRATAHLGMSPGSCRIIGVLEAVGGAGLLLGPAFAPVGVAAATGTALLMYGAAAALAVFTAAAA
nr:DoxX family protein [Streptomyces geranii]